MSHQLIHARGVDAPCPAAVAAPTGAVRPSPARWFRRLLLTGALGVGSGIVLLAAGQSASAEELASDAVGVTVTVTDELVDGPITAAPSAEDLTADPDPAPGQDVTVDPAAPGSAPEPGDAPAPATGPVDQAAPLPPVVPLPDVQPIPAGPALPAVPAPVAVAASSPTSAGQGPVSPSGRPAAAVSEPVGASTDRLAPMTTEETAGPELTPAGPSAPDRTDTARSASICATTPLHAAPTGRPDLDPVAVADAPVGGSPGSTSFGPGRVQSAAVHPLTKHGSPALAHVAPPGPTPAVISAPGAVLVTGAASDGPPQPMPAPPPPLPMAPAVSAASCSSAGVQTAAGSGHRGLQDGPWAVAGPGAAPLLAGAPVRLAGIAAVPTGDAVDPGAGPPD